MKLGLSGNLTRAFIGSPLTPLFLIAALALGLVALMLLPREEEPQISVPLVDVFVKADGLKADDAVKLVTEPLETLVKSLKGVEHVYSSTKDDQVVVTARFLVGTSADDAILRVNAKIRANLDRIPTGIPEPLIVGRGIDDVAIVVVTLAPKPEAASRYDDSVLYRIAEDTQVEMAKLDDVGLSYVVGGRPDQIRVEPNPEKLSLYGVTLAQLIDKVQQANRSFLAGAFRDGGQSVPVVAGQTLQGIPDVGLLLITTRDGRPVYVRDVANVVVGSKPLDQLAWHFRKTSGKVLERAPAVSIAFAKRSGANAVVIAQSITERLDQLRGKLIPDDVEAFYDVGVHPLVGHGKDTCQFQVVDFRLILSRQGQAALLQERPTGFQHADEIAGLNRFQAVRLRMALRIEANHGGGHLQERFSCSGRPFGPRWPGAQLRSLSRRRQGETIPQPNSLKTI